MLCPRSSRRAEPASSQARTAMGLSGRTARSYARHGRCARLTSTLMADWLRRRMRSSCSNVSKPLYSDVHSARFVADLRARTRASAAARAPFGRVCEALERAGAARRVEGSSARYTGRARESERRSSYLSHTRGVPQPCRAHCPAPTCAGALFHFIPAPTRDKPSRALHPSLSRCRRLHGRRRAREPHRSRARRMIGCRSK